MQPDGIFVQLIDVLEEQYWKPAKSIQKAALSAVQPLKDAWNAMVGLHHDTLSLLDGNGAIDTLPKDQIFLPKTSVQLYENSKKQTGAVIDSYKRIFRATDPPQDDWGRPVLTDLESNLQSMQSKDDLTVPLANQLLQLKADTLTEWNTYPQNISSVETPELPAWAWWAAPPTKVYLADALQNKTITTSFSVIQLLHVTFQVTEVTNIKDGLAAIDEAISASV